MIPVVFSTDHNFIMPTGVALLSMLKKSANEELDIFILQSDNVTQEDRDILEKIVCQYDMHISFISMNEVFNNGYEIRDISFAAYYRLLIPWLIPQYDKIIYLDGDIAVCDNIRNLFETEVGDNYYAAVRPYTITQTSFVDWAPKIGVDPNDYVQSGILVINSKKHRDENLNEVFAHHVGKKYPFLDQDIISIVCGKKIAHLPCRYNITPDIYEFLFSDKRYNNHFVPEVEDAKIKPCIYHYAGKKPWKQFTHAWTAWWEEYKTSPFFREDQEYKILKNTYNYDFNNRTLLSFLIRKNIPFIYKKH